MSWYYNENGFSYYREDVGEGVRLYKVHSASGVVVETIIIRK